MLWKDAGANLLPDSPQALYMSFELANKRWKLSFGDHRRSPSRYTIAAADTEAFLRCAAKARERFGPDGSPAEHLARHRSARRLRVELAWRWLRLQPDSDLTAWFNRRFAHGGKRMRRIGIVALARRLAIALWRFLEYGEIPAGASLKQLRSA